MLRRHQTGHLRTQPAGARTAPEPQAGQEARPEGDCLYHLEVVGQGFTIFEDGRIDGPFTFDGSETDGVRSTTFPLHASQVASSSHDAETTSVLTGGGIGDSISRGDETTIGDTICQGPDCGCPDCGPGF